MSGYLPRPTLAPLSRLPPKELALHVHIATPTRTLRPADFAPAAANIDTPVLMCHGDEDMVVQIQWAQAPLIDLLSWLRVLTVLDLILRVGGAC